ncbi:hypothetical protein LSH36_1110g00041 [Paralvinella palmiformis]|uniref:Beta-glucuronidase n=1 Tax=Paralvinella palmiformis TaxID=53620 RepID=A0AAD9MQ71_9ANNE|nr:hypothetical protein LSH36_1110g00041 [Paralvinella palmiformis]
MGKSTVYVCFSILLMFNIYSSCHSSSLYPRPSETRQIQELNGMWNFRADFSPNSDRGFTEKWFRFPLSKTGPVIPMPVPSSFNDITTDKKLRDFTGIVWYDREFYVSPDWQMKRVVLRIDSAHYASVVYVNGKPTLEHIGGHLPFEGEIATFLNFDKVNRITIAVNNTLTPYTLPPGTISHHKNDPRYPPGYSVQVLQFDFFNYAGIHRQVRLYTTPAVYINDITVTTLNIQETNAILKYAVKVGNATQGTTISVEVVNKEGMVLASSSGDSGNIETKAAHLWWPYTMNTTHYGYLYTLKIRGKGLDFPLIARDFNMLKWLGANCFRTSHYPYAEEIMDQADEQGIVVIDESPAVGLKMKVNFCKKNLEYHTRVMTELVSRDKNRPSVIAWSVANEPKSDTDYAADYFQHVINYTKGIDPTRPVTFVSSSDYDKDQVAKYTDFQCINRYYGWYQDTGHTETIATHLSYDLDHWYKVLQKPIMVTEYGADTVPGLHAEPSFVFTEDYQVEFLKQYHAVFDKYRTRFLVGEMVWNFADFMTDQSVTRVLGNKKGILTRQRQPKAAAYVLQTRYWSMINATTPVHDEL